MPGWEDATHFAVSGIEVSPLLPPLVAFAISLVTSTAGVSGAFLLLPFQMSVLGFTTPAVSSTNHLFNIVATPSGVWRYLREGRMVWPIARIIILGSVPGVLVGVVVRVRYLPDPRNFKAFVGLVLLWIAVRLVMSLRLRSGPKSPAEGPISRVSLAEATRRRIRYRFAGQLFEISTPALLSLSLGVGIVGGIYGIGGGALIAPVLVTLFGLPVYTIAGAALAGTCATSAAGVLFYLAISPLFPAQAVAPDWALGLLFGAGGAAGMYCGARLQKLVPARVIRCLLALIVLFVAGRYLLAFLMPRG